MANGPNNQGTPDQDGLTPEIFAQVNWGKAVEADGNINLQKITGVCDDIRKKIIDVLGTQSGGIPGAEKALKDGLKNPPEDVSTMDEAAIAKICRNIMKGSYGKLFGIDANMTDEELENLVGDNTVVLNRYLKLQLKKKDGKVDFTKREDLEVGVKMLKELAVEEGAAGGNSDVASVLNDKVMESKAPAKIFAQEGEVDTNETNLNELTEAAKFLRKASSKKYEEAVAKLTEDKKTVTLKGESVKRNIQDRSLAIEQLEGKIASNKDYAALYKPSGEEGVLSPEVELKLEGLKKDKEGFMEELSAEKVVNKAFQEKKAAITELSASLAELLKHLSVLALPENGCFKGNDPGTIKTQSDNLAKLNLPDDYAQLTVIYTALKGFLDPSKKESVLRTSDSKRGELTDNLRTDKKKLEFSKKNAEGNSELTDSAFALRIIKYKLLKDPENAKLSLEDLEKLAKRTLVEKLWERKNGKAIGEVVDGVESDLLKVIRDAVMKEKVLKFNYKVGDSKKELFKGITPDDLKDKESIERLFGSGKMDIKKAFMLLGLIGGEGGANTPQYKILQKKIFDLLGEQGLTPAQSMKAFREQMEKINAVVSQYSSNYGKTSAIDKELKELKLKKSMEKYRRGELDYEQLQDELEDAGIFKDGKLQEGSVSKLELYSGYVLNHRYAEKFKGRAWDATRDTGKFLGWNLLAAPLFLGGKWAVKGGLSLAGSAVAAPFRLLGYPLALLKAPLHILRHPIKVFTKPGEVFKGAGAKVTEKWVAKAKAGTDRRAKKWAAAGAELGKWKEPFKDPKYNWKSYEDRVKGKPSKDLGKMDARIERLKKKADETAFVLGEEPFLDYSKYKTNTNEEVKKAA